MSEFSRYTSFLELAFGVNLLFSAWDGIYEKLSQLSQQSAASGEQALELAKADGGLQQNITKHRHRCNRCRALMMKTGRATGLVGAIAIAISLLLVPPNQVVNAWRFALIAGAGAIVPSLLAIMVIVDYCYTKWITGRENATVREALVTQANEANKASQIADQVSVSAPPTATTTPVATAATEVTASETAASETAASETAASETAPDPDVDPAGSTS